MITFAVFAITIVTGPGPQLKPMMPPAATARTTAADVQLAALPFPAKDQVLYRPRETWAIRAWGWP